MRVGMVALLALFVASCGGQTTRTATAEPARSRAQPAPAARAPVYVRDVGFQTPESVVHDERADVYLVSNIEGSPLERDHRAFISRVRPDGSIEALRWIDGARPNVELHAPKGLALHGDVLYVADIEAVRKFERVSGEPMGTIALAGASFANDLCTDRSGNVYVTDSGIAAGFTPSNNDAVYRISPAGEVAIIAKDIDLGRPNGIVEGPGGLWVATFGSGELYRLSPDGERQNARRLPKGSLDGVVVHQDRLFVASWEASAIYEQKANGEFVERVSQLAAPSDIGIDRKRARLLIPLFYDNTLVLYPL